MGAPAGAPRRHELLSPGVCSGLPNGLVLTRVLLARGVSFWLLLGDRNVVLAARPVRNRNALLPEVRPLLHALHTAAITSSQLLRIRHAVHLARPNPELHEPVHGVDIGVAADRRQHASHNVHATPRRDLGACHRRGAEERRPAGSNVTEHDACTNLTICGTGVNLSIPGAFTHAAVAVSAVVPIQVPLRREDSGGSAGSTRGDCVRGTGARAVQESSSSRRYGSHCGCVR